MLQTSRFADLYSWSRRSVISFEIFPPKSDAALARLIRILPGLAALHPDFFTVTYGAFGSTRVNTLEIATHIVNQYNVPAACHLTCVGSSRAELDQILERYYARGIRNIVALRGDPPQGAKDFTPPPDGLAHADDLVQHIHRFTSSQDREGFGVAVAGYPEKHPEAPDFETDLRFLKRKVDAGAGIVITQLFFDAECYFRFVQAARARGIHVPIVPGLMPIQSAAQVKRMAAMCGASIPADLQAELASAAGHEEREQEIGVRRCLNLARTLLRRGAPGIHFYVLNQFNSVRRIFEQLRR